MWKCVRQAPAWYSHDPLSEDFYLRREAVSSDEVCVLTVEVEELICGGVDFYGEGYEGID